MNAWPGDPLPALDTGIFSLGLSGDEPADLDVDPAAAFEGLAVVARVVVFPLKMRSSSFSSSPDGLEALKMSLATLGARTPEWTSR